MSTLAMPKNIDAYIATVPMTHRPALMKLRAQIKKWHPLATEHIAYGRPLFKIDGHPLLAFRVTKKHSSVFVWSGTALKALGDLLDGYDTEMGTVRFAPDTPLPERLLKAILRARVKEIQVRWGGKKLKTR